VKKLNTYDVLSIMLISITVTLFFLRYTVFPVFVDIYYHMSVALSFDKAGGIVFWDFWEFAPEGRPHLYPPLLHCIMLFLSEFSDHIAVGRFISFIMFPASQVTMWFFSREILSRKTAFYAVLILSASIEYFRLQAITSAAALVLVLVPLVFYAFEKGKYSACTILLALCLYTHVGMGPTALGAFALYAIFRRFNLKKAATIMVASLVLYLPWGAHVLSNIGSLSSRSATSGASLAVFPLFFGIVGILICIQRKKEFLIPVCIFIAMIPMAFSYLGRFAGHSILPLAMLSGVTLSEIDEKLAARKRPAFIIGTVIVFSLFSPVVTAQMHRNLQQSEIPGPLQQRNMNIRLASLPVFFPRMPTDSYLTPDNLEMAEIISRKTTDNEIVFIRGGIMGCFVTATTGRPQMFGMWQEVAADFEPDPKSASIFVLQKNSRVPATLTRIGETDGWAVFKAPEKKIVATPSATIRKEIIYLIMAIALAILLYDFVHLHKKLL
jgi:hypothetical protein